MSLTEYLTIAGYHRIPLFRSGVGHFHANGRLGEHQVSATIDTGAASTIVSLAKARDLGLNMAKLPFQGGGAGAERMDLFQVLTEQLFLDDVLLKVRSLMSMDLSHVNAALKLKGADPIDVVIGVDVFDSHKAIIDYGSESLFLAKCS